MKLKRRFLAMVLVVSLLLCNFVSITANAATSNADSNEPAKVSVYNGVGEFVGEFDSVQDFESEFLNNSKSQRGVGVVIAAILSALGKVTSVLFVASVFTGVDPASWIHSNVVVPFVEEAKKMELYSISGGITNPYPPNSYQYSQFNKTNYYWVVE